MGVARAVMDGRKSPRRIPVTTKNDKSQVLGFQDLLDPYVWSLFYQWTGSWVRATTHCLGIWATFMYPC